MSWWHVPLLSAGAQCLSWCQGSFPLSVAHRQSFLLLNLVENGADGFPQPDHKQIIERELQKILLVFFKYRAKSKSRDTNKSRKQIKGPFHFFLKIGSFCWVLSLKDRLSRRLKKKNSWVLSFLNPFSRSGTFSVALHRSLNLIRLLASHSKNDQRVSIFFLFKT